MISDKPGRVCSVHYHYGAKVLTGAEEQRVDALYIIGGLYGNLPALHAVEALVKAENHPVRLVFNGDFNWFNVDDAGFVAINQRVLHHDATLGNVETELIAGNSEAGCGCAYPPGVDDEVVARSNMIHARLKSIAQQYQPVLEALKRLPMVRRYRVDDCRVGVVHGDSDSSAGWRFDVAALDDPASLSWLEQQFVQAQVDVFASTHTCLPVMRCFHLDGRDCVVANNGAAGMPNFRGECYGLLTRIAISPSPHPSLYGCQLGSAFIDTLPVHYVQQDWFRDFRINWSPGSPADLSYFQRIVNGPDYMLAQARPDFAAP